MINLKSLKENKVFYLRVLAIAVPFMLQQLIGSSVNLLDNLMVGQLGDAAIAGVASANKFYMVAMFAIMGLSGAASIFIAQYFGAKDEEHVKQSFRYSLIASYVIILPFVVLGWMFPEGILRFFTSDPAVIEQGTAYLRIALMTYIPMTFSMAVGSAMRSVGETKIPLYTSIVAILSNAFFNYCLIFGNLGFPRLGVQGAALATLIARIIEVIVIAIVLKKKHFIFNTKIKDLFKISTRLEKAITLKAIPLTTNEIFWSAGMGLLFKFYSTRGTEVMAGMSISSTIADIFFTLFGGMMVATTVVISQALGANKLDEARQDAYKLISFSRLLAVLLGILMFGASYIVPQWYDVSAVSRATSETFLRIMACMFWLYMSNAQCFFILRAGGDTKSTLLMDAVFMWLVNLPVVGAVAYFTNWNVYVIYLIGQSTDFLKFYFAYGLVKKEKWVKNLSHIHEEKVPVFETPI
jgi:putative MATE family efflux protein